MTDEFSAAQFTAKTLSEALPYIQRYAGQIIVVKYGGHAMVDETLSAMFARDVVLLKTLGIHPVIVHGGGPQIGKLLDRLGIVSEFKGGLRVTDEATMEVVEMVLSGPINKSIVRAVNQAGGLAVGLSGSDGQLLQATKATKTERDPDSHIEQVLDLGFVGEPTGVDTSVIEALLKADSQLIPVVAPVAMGPGRASLQRECRHGGRRACRGAGGQPPDAADRCRRRAGQGQEIDARHPCGRHSAPDRRRHSCWRHDTEA
jgi:acetylglutamate kinase